jgi:hypothetical protein
MFGTSRTEDTVSETYKGFFDASLLSPSCSHYALLLYQNPLFPLPCLGQVERAIRCLKYKDFSNASLSSSSSHYTLLLLYPNTTRAVEMAEFCKNYSHDAEME